MPRRLKLGIDEYIDAYLSLSDRVFQKKRRRVTVKGGIQGRFNSDKPERAVKEVVTKQGLHENELLKDASDDTCKVWVRLIPRLARHLLIYADSCTRQANRRAKPCASRATSRHVVATTS